jgi:hypothetical protein
VKAVPVAAEDFQTLKTLANSSPGTPKCFCSPLVLSIIIFIDTKGHENIS